MPVLTDRQRIELAVPAYLLYALTGAPGVFVPADPDLAEKAEADVTALREDLRTACFEPFADLTPNKRNALLRRLERIKQQVIVDWGQHSALNLMLMIFCFLKDLIDREVLILWEDSAMDRAMQKSMPMCRYNLKSSEDRIAAHKQAGALLDRFQAQNIYC